MRLWYKNQTSYRGGKVKSVSRHPVMLIYCQLSLHDHLYGQVIGPHKYFFATVTVKRQEVNLKEY